MVVLVLSTLIIFILVHLLSSLLGLSCLFLVLVILHTILWILIKPVLLLCQHILVCLIVFAIFFLEAKGDSSVSSVPVYSMAVISEGSQFLLSLLLCWIVFLILLILSYLTFFQIKSDQISLLIQYLTISIYAHKLHGFELRLQGSLSYFEWQNYSVFLLLIQNFGLSIHCPPFFLGGGWVLLTWECFAFTAGN